MPEGDTVYRQCRILDEALAGGVLTRADLRVPALATADLVGREVREVRPRGKHLLIRLGPDADPLTLHSHLMMDGIWQVDGVRLSSSDTSSAARAMHTARIVLEFEHPGGRTAEAIGFDVKQVRLVRTADEAELVGHLGPDLLDPAWGEKHRGRAVAALTAEPERPLGLALLDQRIMAGLGNIYRSELCFLQRLHPARPVADLADPGALVDLARRLLELNSDRTVRVTTGGMLGRDGDLWVYDRAGKPCRRCHARIQRGELDEPRQEAAEPRVIFTCPRCQPAPGATVGAASNGRRSPRTRNLRGQGNAHDAWRRGRTR